MGWAGIDPGSNTGWGGGVGGKGEGVLSKRSFGFFKTNVKALESIQTCATYSK